MRPIAYLAPEIPSVSCTFVYREALAVERTTGRVVLPYSLRAVPEEAIASDGQQFVAKTRVIYSSLVTILIGAGLHCLAHPIASARSAFQALRDSLMGERKSKWKAIPQLIAGLSLARDLRRRNVEHLHIHFAHAVSTVGMYAAGAARLPFSITAHANDIYVHRELLLEKVERAQSFLTISEVNRRYLIDELGSAAERVKVVRCGIDLEHFDPGSFTSTTSTIFSVGRLVPKKGFDTLLLALGGLEHDFKCVIAGEGPHRSRLEELVESLGLSDRVQFLGAVTTEVVREHLNDASLFVLPCRTDLDGDVDGIPVALMEAMACGVPVISTRVSGIPELIEHGKSGYLVDPGDSVELAVGITSLTGNPDEATCLARAGRDRIEQDYDADSNAEELFRQFQLETLSRRVIQDGTKSAAESRYQRSKSTKDDWHGSCLPKGMNTAEANRVETGNRVVVITPARNEEQFLPGIVATMVAQTVRPALWIIVDDGSTDSTAALAEEAAAIHPWIRVIRRNDRGHRVLGSGVIAAFDEGLEAVDVEYDYVGKMDADLTFGPRYLEHALCHFDLDPQLGALSGKVFRPENGSEVEEFMIDEMVAGQWKLYRRSCFEQIGGFVRAVMWDGIDFHQARRQGWRTRSIPDGQLRISHHRLMGSSDRGVLTGRLRLGRGQWFLGSHPLYTLASAIFRMLERPRIIGGLLIITGYVQAWLRGEPRYGDVDFRRALHDWQFQRLGRLALGRVR